jgi:DNA-binding transcriptional LysR family regulator
VPDVNWLAEVSGAGAGGGQERRARLEVNSLNAMARAIHAGAGIGALPDWMGPEMDGLVRLLPDLGSPKVQVYFVYPEELRNSKRVAVFRDFLVARLQELQ